MSHTTSRFAKPRSNVTHSLAGNATSTVMSFGTALLTSTSNPAGSNDVAKIVNSRWKPPLTSSGEKVFSMSNLNSNLENKDKLDSTEAGSYHKNKKRSNLRPTSSSSSEWNLLQQQVHESSKVQHEDVEAGSYMAALDGYVEQLESMSWEDSSSSVLQIVSDMMIEVNSVTMIDDVMDVDEQDGVPNNDRQLLGLIAEEKRQIRNIIEEYVNSFQRRPARNPLSSSDRPRTKHAASDSISDDETTAEITRDLFAQLDC
jgi:hypothetical protein